MAKPRRRQGFVAAAVTLAFACALLATGTARANVPFQTINSGAPLNQLFLGNDLSCQVKLSLDDVFSFFPPQVAPGDCGTFVEVSGSVYSPNFDAHDGTATGALSSVPFSAVSQTGVSGSGSAGSPYTVDTVVDAGATGVRVSERTTYVAGESTFLSRITLANTSGAAAPATLYRAGDCFLAGTDDGYGAIDTAGGAFCSENPNNQPDGRLIGFKQADATPSSYQEEFYSDIWSSIDGAPFANFCECDVLQDNGAGLSWELNVPAGGQTTVLVTTRAIAGPDPFQGTTGVRLEDPSSPVGLSPDLSSAEILLRCNLPATSSRSCEPVLGLSGELDTQALPRAGHGAVDPKTGERATQSVQLAQGQVTVPPDTAQTVTIPTTAEGVAALQKQQALAKKLSKKAKKLSKKAKKLKQQAKATSGKEAQELKQKAKKLSKKAKKLSKKAKKLLIPAGAVQVSNPRNGASESLSVTVQIPAG